MLLPEATPPRVSPVRRARRRRQLLATALAGVLAWAGVSYLAESGQVAAPVSVLPGAAADGSVANVVPLASSGSVSSGAAGKLVGVKFARIDLALAAQDTVRVTLAWTNPNEFSRATATGAWQIRLGLYYPVRTGTCGGGAPDHAVNVSLPTTESWNGSVQTFCAYRDEVATGPGAVTAIGDENRGTQFLASNFLVGALQPKTAIASPAACTASGTVPCSPDGLGANQRALLVIGSLLNPGGNIPVGQVGNLSDMDLFVRVSKAGG